MRVTLPATIAELRAVIVDLRASNARLEERVRDLETRVGLRNPPGTLTPPGPRERLPAPNRQV